jgi:hypothetical protein
MLAVRIGSEHMAVDFLIGNLRAQGSPADVIMTLSFYVGRASDMLRLLMSN